MHVEQRAIRVENQGFDPHLPMFKLLRPWSIAYDELYQAFVGRSGALQHRACVLRPMGGRPRAPGALLGGRVGQPPPRYSFWDIQTAANRSRTRWRLSRSSAATASLSSCRSAPRPRSPTCDLRWGDRAAASHLFGPEALEYRVNHCEAAVAIVRADDARQFWAIKDRLTHLRHVIGVGGAREAGVHSFEALVEKASRQFNTVDTAAHDPALIIYTSGTTARPKERSRRTGC